MKGQPNLLDLPAELVGRILTCSSVQDKSSMSMTCRRLRNQLRGHEFGDLHMARWRRHYAAKFEMDPKGFADKLPRFMIEGMESITYRTKTDGMLLKRVLSKRTKPLAVHFFGSRVSQIWHFLSILDEVESRSCPFTLNLRLTNAAAEGWSAFTQYADCVMSLSLSNSDNLRELAPLKVFNNLESLTLVSCHNLIHIDSASELPEHLQSLVLSNCKQLEVFDASAVGSNSLRSVSMDDLPLMYNAKGLASFPQLRTLSLRSCVNMNNVSWLPLLPAGCKVYMRKMWVRDMELVYSARAVGVDVSTVSVYSLARDCDIVATIRDVASRIGVASRLVVPDDLVPHLQDAN
eukprot:Clim_evm117s149 gene=Clim_evmTU117s149